MKTEPTCTAKGEKLFKCTVCGATKTEAIPEVDHTVVTDKAVAATCTESGLTEGKHCGVCNTVLVPQQTVAAKGHVWDNPQDDTCNVCGEKRDVEKPEEPEERVLDVWDGTVGDGFGGGQGTESDPFLIYTAEELAFMAHTVNNGNFEGAYFKLMADLDLAGIEWTPIGQGSNSSFDYENAGADRFCGHFDGNGHVIYRLQQLETYFGRSGLFGAVGYSTMPAPLISDE